MALEVRDLSEIPLRPWQFLAYDLRLDLSRVDDEMVPCARPQLSEQGLRLSTLARERERSGALEAIYRLHLDCYIRQPPTALRRAPIPFHLWHWGSLEAREEALPEAYFLVMDGKRYVGLSTMVRLRRLPGTTDVAAATEMWQAARDSGLTAMVAHEFRFASGRMRVKELLDEGYVGKPQLVLMRLVQGGGGGGRGGGGGAASSGEVPAYAAERDSAAMGAGFLWGLGSHYIDCLRHWLGEVVSVSGEVRNFRPDRMSGSEMVKADADDTFLFTLNFANGAIAHMVGSRSAPFGAGPGVEVYGSEGALVTPQRGVNPPAHGTILGARVGDPAGLQALPIPERLQPFADDRDDRLMPFRLMVREFVRGIREGTSPAPNFYDGLRDQQIMNAVRESSVTGRRIEIPPPD